MKVIFARDLGQLTGRDRDNNRYLFYPRGLAHMERTVCPDLNAIRRIATSETSSCNVSGNLFFKSNHDQFKEEKF